MSIPCIKERRGIFFYSFIVEFCAGAFNSLGFKEMSSKVCLTLQGMVSMFLYSQSLLL